MTGGEALAQMIKAAEGGPMFGMGGFQLLPFYDAARRLGLDHHLINDERCAVFLADAYAKVSGRVGLADATLGPGATNLVTGLVEALNAGSPLVVIVGDANRDHAGKNMTQETDQAAILKPAVKAFLRLESVARIPEMMRRAFEIATTGRPGPVVVDVPEDIAHGTHGFEEGAFHVDPIFASVPALRCRPDADALDEAAAILARAERPMVLAGGGVHLSGAAEVLTRFAEENGIPVAHTMTGKGAIPCTHPMSAGLFGRYDRIANDLIAVSDALLVVGCKLGEIATKRYIVPPTDRTIIHLDIVAEEMGRTFEPTVRLWGDARAGLQDLAAALSPGAGEAKARRAAYHAEIADKMAAWRKEAAPRYDSEEVPIGMGRLIRDMRAELPDDGIFIADGGFAAHWGGLLFDTRLPGRAYVPDRGFASIGYGLPGAMGAKLAAPGRTVVALTGDGGFNMTLGELETAIRMRLAVTIVVVNNAASGYVKALQHLMYGEGSYQSSDLHETDYAAVARAMGAAGIRVTEPDALPAAFREAFARTDGPTVLDVVVTRDAGKMLPAADSRAVKVKKGDRVA
ncbi:thiamine pyrophosphate-binding protein [Acuticoccus sp. 2012]|uniref:Thiamine pyrophosphate-binding protein n=2 Tax=Acuticoccus mangrovi TaxID=2796142 RepID=A0A934MEE5_9HYPH|nr:thiamine pyrophosphate-binding protein [Acuticoccus mangrovi]MBJ3777417.1 thiamine pyrophosphate-binding protein [Acuticoccus mangrovi]